MKVFNACMIIIRRHIGAFALYFGVFIALTVVMTSLSIEQYSTAFAVMKPDFTVINRDGDTPLSKGLVTYLAEHGVEVALEDQKDVLQDATFFHATDFIAILPQGFHDAFVHGKPLAIETVTTTESAKGYYADSLVNQYLNMSRVYQTAAPDMDEEVLVSTVLKDLAVEAHVEKKQFGESAPVNESFQIYSRMICYIIMVLIILCVSNITSAFRRPDIRMRNMCAPMKSRIQSYQQILCGLLVSIVAWVLMIALGFIMYGKNLGGTDGKIIALILLNAFVVTLVALAIASLASSFIRNANTQNAIANFMSLALCFLGGVFVPLEMFGEGLLTVARFTPTYWYVSALDRICALTSFGADVLAPIWQAMLIQLAFGTAILCVSLVVNKHQSQSERSFGSVQTELEA